MAKAALKTKTKKLWGTEFRIVDGGLSETEVADHVASLTAELNDARKEVDRQSSLVRLAEQTVMEADRLAGEITSKARERAEKEASEIKAEAEADATMIRDLVKAETDKLRDELIEKARAEAEEIVSSARQSAVDSSAKTIEAAATEAKSCLERADREANELLESSRAHVANVQSEAKLEAEYAVRRITQTLAEGLRHTVTESLNTYLSLVDKISVEPASSINGSTTPSVKAAKS